MSYPTMRVSIKPNGDSEILGMEHTDDCHEKLTGLAKKAGKVTSITDEDHTPVYQSVHMKGA